MPTIEINAEAPERIHLVPAGDVVRGRDGRIFQVPDFAVLKQAFIANAAELPVDIEHATEIKAPAGEPAPAMGWVTDIEQDADGIWASVDWTEAGREMVSKRAYRYVSPVFEVDVETREIAKILNVGLTNRPNLTLKALNSASVSQADFIQKKEALVADEKETETVVSDVAMEAPEAPAPVAEPAVAQAADPAREANAVPAKVDAETLKMLVPRAELEVWKNRALEAEGKVLELQHAQDEAEIAGAVDSAVREGKISPASKALYVEMCRNGGLDAFKAHIAATEPLVNTKYTTAINARRARFDATLSDAEVSLCARMGLSEDEFKAQKIAQHKAREG